MLWSVVGTQGGLVRKFIWLAAVAVAVGGSQPALAEKYFARQQLNIGQRGELAPKPDSLVICAALRQEVLGNGSGRVVGHASSAPEAAAACQSYATAENAEGVCSWMQEVGQPGQVTYYPDGQITEVPGWSSMWASACTRG